MHRVSLRSRIILSLVIIVTVTSTIFATGVVLIKQQLEEVIFGEMVHDQLLVLITQLDDNAEAEPALFENWMFYYDEKVAQLHPDIIALSEGSHHSVIIEDNYYQVEVGSRNNQPVYLTYDITDWENQEHTLLEMLAYGVGVVLIAAIFMGVLASKTILNPVKSLANKLAHLQPKQRNVRIASEYQGNEVAQIAEAFDRYLEQLDQFVDRERSFTAAASHELRTPLSVMMGAIDVMDVQELSPVSARALARIKRACAEMLAFIEATLFLSREENRTINQTPPSALKDIIAALLEDNAQGLNTNQIDITTNLGTTMTLKQPDTIVKIMIGNILRNAIEHTQQGKIIISLSKGKLTIADTGSGIPQQDLPHIFDRSYTTKESGTGLGLNLVKRICDRFNWTINIQSELKKGTRVEISFS